MRGSRCQPRSTDYTPTMTGGKAWSLLHRALAAGAVWVVIGPLGAPGAVPSMTDVLEGMRKLEDRVRSLPSWKVTYRQERRFSQYLPQGMKADPMPVRECVFARKGEWYYVEVKEGDVVACYVSRDTVAVNRRGSIVSIETEPNVGLWESCFYTNSLFLNIRSQRKYEDPRLRQLHGQSSPYESMLLALPQSVAVRREKYRVRPALELVDGAACAVLEHPGADIIWVDVNLGFVCRRRQVFHPDGGLMLEHRNEGFREWLPGLWLPVRTRKTGYNDLRAMPVEIRGKPFLTQENVVLAMSFDPLPDSFFNVPLPETGATRVVDQIRGLDYLIHPGEATPEELVDQALRIAKAGAWWHAGRPWVIVMCAVSAVVLGCVLLGYQIRRLRRQRELASPPDR